MKLNCVIFLFLGSSILYSCNQFSKKEAVNSASTNTEDSICQSAHFYYENEIFLDNWLKLNIPSSEVIDRLNLPSRKSKTESTENSGTLIQIWEYPQYGLTLLMEMNNANHPVQLYGIEAIYPCKLKTPRGAGIGSSLQVLLQAYPQGRHLNGGFSIGNPYGFCMSFHLHADTVNKIVIFQDFD